MLFVSIFVDLVLYVIFHRFEDEGRCGNDVFIPFEQDGMNYRHDNNNQNSNHGPDGGQHYPDDFGEF